ncbi:hypothetical protein HHI36_007441 [Cryptolaemus montrouzieri]|uniref:Endonuclease/exonuclease/phosphatase domain-containing protein n=1 Tax=Cryptolaemus montrouzieri TaxID=559131 RepID=A0ABD2MPI0_9CUCU
MEAKEIDFIRELPIEDQVEMSAVDVQDHNLVIVCIYRPPKGNVNCFVAQVDAALNRISNESFQHILVAGDINADFLKDSKEKVKIENLMKSYGLHTVFHVPGVHYQFSYCRSQGTVHENWEAN